MFGEKFDYSMYPKTVDYYNRYKTEIPVYCNRCGGLCLESETGGYYSYQCMFCDEDLFEVEVHSGFLPSKEHEEELLLRMSEILCLDE